MPDRPDNPARIFPPSVGQLPGDTCAAGRPALGWRLFAMSFTALFLELMLIRWAPSVVRLVAYYANLLLVSSFLGLGLGAMVCKRQWHVFRWFSWFLAADLAIVLLCQHVTMPGSRAEFKFYNYEIHLLNYVVLVSVFLANTVLFVPLGEQIGLLFAQIPPLRAYTWDLLGSLCGTLCFGLFSFLYFSPLLGLAAVVVIIIALSEARERWKATLILLACLLAMWRANDADAIWSPYYYIVVRDRDAPQQPAGEPPADLRTMMNPPMYNVSVNRDFYQLHGTIDERRFTPYARQSRRVKILRDQYLVPYAIAGKRDRVVVLGSGGGMDVEAALLSGVGYVDAVDIDPQVIALSRKYSAAGVYDDARVRVHVDDARAFLQRARPGYDLVVFGFLDSQTLFSSMSNLRLDGFTYTVESIRSSFALLNDGGVLSLSFSAGRPWLAQKIVRMIKEAVDAPLVVYTYLDTLIVCAINGPAGNWPERLGDFARARIDPDQFRDAPAATDNWPFLYLSKMTIPSDYLVVIGVIAALSVLSVLLLRGVSFSVDDGHFLFMGLGFLLLETKSIGDCSLYFGSTWLVTMIVVAGVLLMVLAANLLAFRLPFTLAWYVPLFASLLLLYFVPHAWVLAQPWSGRLLWAVLAVPLPIFFAGIIFSTSFRDQANPSALFGANLVGAMIGGFCEYLGMATGTSFLTLIVIAAYVASLACNVRRTSAGRLRTAAG